MQRKKICFVVNTLAQHGAERYLYEISKVLCQNNFDVTVLMISTLNNSNDHYYKPLTNLGAKIILFDKDDLYPNKNLRFKKKALNSITFRINKSDKIKKIQAKNLTNILIKYDLISIIKWEVYTMYPNVFDCFNNKYIHLLSALDQYSSNPYIKLSNQSHKFILMYHDQKEEVINTNFENKVDVEKLFFETIPLFLGKNHYLNTYSPHQSEKRIGVFTRISEDQPSLFNLYALHLLKKRYPNIKLLFFGKFTSKTSKILYQNTVKFLSIENNIEFVGHVKNIKQSIKDYQLNIGWMNSVNEFIGYSSLELLSSGLPVLFFNISEIKKNNLHNSFSNSLKTFIDKTDLFFNGEFKVENQFNNFNQCVENIKDIYSKVK